MDQLRDQISLRVPAPARMMVATILWLSRGCKDDTWLRQQPCRWPAAEAVVTMRDAEVLADWNRLVALYSGWQRIFHGTLLQGLVPCDHQPARHGGTNGDGHDGRPAQQPHRGAAEGGRKRRLRPDVAELGCEPRHVSLVGPDNGVRTA